MSTFLQAAQQILREAGEPLHYRQITERALQSRLLASQGQTPWATMNAILAMDIKSKGEQSPFVRTDPGHFGLRQKAGSEKAESKSNASIKYPINEHVSTKQKGDLAESRVAELITLYGREGLTCYKPISDDEGIDIIVKRRGQLEVVYIQVKSTYGYGERGFVSTVKESALLQKERQLLVFVYFDLSAGDLYEQIFCLSAPSFLKLSENPATSGDRRVFSVGLRDPAASKYAEHMIEKRELANRIVELMDRL